LKINKTFNILADLYISSIKLLSHAVLKTTIKIPNTNNPKAIVKYAEVQTCAPVIQSKKLVQSKV